MPGFEFAERIDRSREEVFDFLVDFDRASEWAPEITRVEMLTDGPLATSAPATARCAGRPRASPASTWR